MSDENRFSSPTIGALAGALAKAQAIMPSAPKTRSATVFKGGGGYSYADLAECLKVALPALSQHGLVIIQTTEPTERGHILRTLLAHASGEWVASEFALQPAQNTPQGVGSAITYARRYALMAICGMAAEDDDGQEGSHPTRAAAAAVRVFNTPDDAANRDTFPAMQAKRSRGRPAQAQLAEAEYVPEDRIQQTTSTAYTRLMDVIAGATTDGELNTVGPMLKEVTDPLERENLIVRAKQVRSALAKAANRGVPDNLRQRLEGDKPA